VYIGFFTNHTKKKKSVNLIVRDVEWQYYDNYVWPNPYTLVIIYCNQIIMDDNYNDLGGVYGNSVEDFFHKPTCEN
jgi:hypothetical protein